MRNHIRIDVNFESDCINWWRALLADEQAPRALRALLAECCDCVVLPAGQAYAALAYAAQLTGACPLTSCATDSPLTDFAELSRYAAEHSAANYNDATWAG